MKILSNNTVNKSEYYKNLKQILENIDVLYILDEK